MKKLVALTVLMVSLSVSAEDKFSINGVEEPQWKDFVPPAYVNVKAPRGLGKFNDTAAYWYKRRVEFESGIEKCRDTEKTEAKVTCYQQLKVKQYQKNSDYNARLEAIERTQRGPQEMMNPTGNMVPLGGYLDSFTRFQPNEFR